ncbi:MAG: HD domain-containing phosphohydrolase, partial [Eubacteriales bacterium]
KVILTACRDISQRIQAEKGLRDAEWKFKALFKKGPIGVAYHSMIYDDAGKPIDYFFIDANKAYTELTGVEPVGKTVLEAFPGIENDPFDWIGVFGKVAKTGEPTRFEQYLAFNKNYYDIVCYQYEPDHFVAAFINITARKEWEIAFANEKKLLETTFMSVGDGIISTDYDGKIILINKVAEALTGWTQEEAFEKPIEEVFIIFDELTGTRIKTPVKKALNEKKTITFTSQTQLISKDGQKHPIEDSVAPILTDDNEITGAVIVFRDVSALRKKQEEINFLVNCDKLTGLYNRRYFDSALFKFDKERYYPLTLVMTDVNGLKLTNDAFGHNAGDVVLVRVTNILKKECREDDVVARIGGDEFVLLLPKTDAIHAEAIIARINDAIAKLEPSNIALSLSMGFAVKNDSYEDIGDVFKKAEDEMYRHKLTESTSMRSKTIDLIKSTLFETNNREMLHSNRVSEICVAIAENMDISQDDIDKIRLIGLMHDIGKIGVETSILDSPHKLRNDEWAKVKRHSEIGYRILSSFNEFSEMADCVLEHHERWDGKGYPRGIKGENISLFARIIAVADAYDAMTADRTYRVKISDEEAKAEILKGAGTQFDPEIAKIFVEMVFVD